MFRSFHFWYLVTSGEEVKKIRKYYLPNLCLQFVRQDGQDGKKCKENHATKVTKIPKTKRWKYGRNKTLNYYLGKLSEIQIAPDNTLMVNEVKWQSPKIAAVDRTAQCSQSLHCRKWTGNWIIWKLLNLRRYFQYRCIFIKINIW